jgi:hypothetical protein
MSNGSIPQVYRERAERFTAALAAERKRIRALSNARFIVFVVAVVVLWQLWATPLVVWGVAALAFALFIFLVGRHRAARARAHDLDIKLQFCAQGIARQQRAWTALPLVVRDDVAPDHPYASDLELFGRPALTQLFGPLHTLHGQRTLRSSLLTRVSPEQIRERQEAVRQLAREIDYRDELGAATHRTVGPGQERLDQFIDWVANTRLSQPSAALVWLARVIPVITMILAALQVAGVVSRAWWMLPLAASAALAGLTLKRIYRTFDAAFAKDPAPLGYSAAFDVAQRVPGDEQLIARIREQLHANGASAAQRIRRLEQIMLYADVRHSGTASALLELFFLWSFHISVALRRWQEEARADLPAWFDALGTLEALCSMSALAHDEPDWCFPEMDNTATTIDAAQLGHPMLPEHVRVHNDVVIGPAGSTLLVTGSNMSGKSTLLRSIGANSVLAQAGAPVCAQRYHAPVLRLYTSVNVRDSLAAGVSLYMAQLHRIKTVLDAAEASAPELCCYLLDEILSGTNSADRTTAVRAIMHRLMQLPAIGALATHDLALAADEKISATAHTIHFRESIEDGVMTFDYRIREGPLQSTNALTLLRLMGIDV